MYFGKGFQFIAKNRGGGKWGRINYLHKFRVGVNLHRRVLQNCGLKGGGRMGDITTKIGRRDEASRSSSCAIR